MSRTERIYNRKLKKAQRTNIDSGLVQIIRGIPLTRRSHICMGRCVQCRDPNKEQKTIRKRTKEGFRLQLERELRASAGEDFMSHPYAPWEMET